MSDCPLLGHLSFIVATFRNIRLVLWFETDDARASTVVEGTENTDQGWDLLKI
jgi:hypothetical protein